MFFIIPTLLLIIPLIVVIYFHKPSSNSLSVKNIFQSIQSSFVRYPAVVCFAGLATLTALYAVYTERWDENIYELGTAFIFGISLSYSIYELFKNHRARSFIVLLSLPVVFFSYYVQKDQSTVLFSIRWVQFFLLSHLLASFATFLYDTSQEKFWRHNKQLLTSFLIATIYSGCIFIGLAVAFGAVQYLFEIKDSSWIKIYPSLLAICGLFIHPLIFLGALTSHDEGEDGFSSVDLRAIRIFGSYILIPIVLLYLGILLSYEIKIAVAGELPKGRVGWLVCSFGLAGTLTWLLTYPLGKDEGGIGKIFHRRFFNFFLPLLALLCVAVYERTSSYGFTELRYVLFILTVWISIITVIFTLKPRSQIKLIPISLFLLTLCSIYGPLSAYTVSYKSQISRFTSLLLSKTKCEKVPEGTFSLVDTKKISSTLKYLVRNHDEETLSFLKSVCVNNSEATAFINDYLKDESSSHQNREHTRGIDYWSFTRGFLKTLQINAIQEHEGVTNLNDKYFSFSSSTSYPQKSIDISGLKELILNIYLYDSHTQPTKSADNATEFQLKDSTLVINYKNKTMNIDLVPLVYKLFENTRTKYISSAIPPEEMTLVEEKNGVRIKVFLQSIRGDKDNNKIIIRGLSGNIGVGIVE